MIEQRFITIDGVGIAVTEEVYRAYKRPAWVERKRRQVRVKKELSLEILMESDDIISSSKPFETAVEDKLLITVMCEALKLLPSYEHDLMYALFFERITVRDYAQRIGTNHTKVIRERDRILRILKNYF